MIAVRVVSARQVGSVRGYDAAGGLLYVTVYLTPQQIAAGMAWTELARLTGEDGKADHG